MGTDLLIKAIFFGDLPKSFTYQNGSFFLKANEANTGPQFGLEALQRCEAMDYGPQKLPQKLCKNTKRNKRLRIYIYNTYIYIFIYNYYINYICIYIYWIISDHTI
jgi:hypothetical protein